jgi:hypothetical protein
LTSCFVNENKDQEERPQATDERQSDSRKWKAIYSLRPRGAEDAFVSGLTALPAGTQEQKI